MSLSARLITLRRQLGLSQQAMADAVGVHPNSWKKYESGQAQPSLEVLKKIAIKLHVSTDFLLFNEQERGPSDEFRLRFEAISSFSMEEKQVVKEILDSLILKHQAKLLFTPQQTGR
ncbi:helix-turn-helix domain-containing protein [Chitinimonas sp. BJB300]|uniref:helix-turn-helix domain-containing protein n=1 Tax=Chitinimonas sp. BJB300 TaxID=1559339 RepID=UPI000C0FB168|nr:helix-turn-helix transcriptional regulator [Chitinimonas sp. BJB300]PHV12090.1 transcriptional regulator [Chitinimonas sp. BJB300]TSJ83759.1 helix-turn-helix transcriptional regulator [Chitinimonas sp. BJB300]